MSVHIKVAPVGNRPPPRSVPNLAHLNRALPQMVDPDRWLQAIDGQAFCAAESERGRLFSTWIIRPDFHSPESPGQANRWLSLSTPMSVSLNSFMSHWVTSSCPNRPLLPSRLRSAFSWGKQRGTTLPSRSLLLGSCPLLHTPVFSFPPRVCLLRNTACLLPKTFACLLGNTACLLQNTSACLAGEILLACSKNIACLAGEILLACLQKHPLACWEILLALLQKHRLACWAYDVEYPYRSRWTGKTVQ